MLRLSSDHLFAPVLRIALNRGPNIGATRLPHAVTFPSVFKGDHPRLKIVLLIRGVPREEDGSERHQYCERTEGQGDDIAQVRIRQRLSILTCRSAR
jgi:hypothetical protein